MQNDLATTAVAPDWVVGHMIKVKVKTWLLDFGWAYEELPEEWVHEKHLYSRHARTHAVDAGRVVYNLGGDEYPLTVGPIPMGCTSVAQTVIGDRGSSYCLHVLGE